MRSALPGKLFFVPLVTASVLVMAPAPSRADVTLGGHVKSFVFQQLGDPWELALAGARLQLAARGSVGDVASFYGAVDFQLDSRLLAADQSLRRGEGLDVFPVEIYALISKGPVDLKLGQQFVFWGRTSWVNPTDVITAWDYPNMASEIEDYRRAPLAARLQWSIMGELVLDAVWVPIFRPNRLGPFTVQSMSGLPVVEGEALLPEAHAKNGEFGLRLSQTVSRWAFDWAIAAYKGFEKMPAMVFMPRYPAGATAPDALVLTRHYDPLYMVGVDIAKAYGPLVFKAEGALKITDDWKGDDLTVGNSRVEAVAGIDYALGDTLKLGAQYIHTTRINYSRA
ncbi:MAG: hypothetical protein JRH20_21210, partial [Deltaproteobacteria bacterium]|nr:hypothetical protein [Deltaproteobacteria bacterium]